MMNLRQAQAALGHAPRPVARMARLAWRVARNLVALSPARSHLFRSDVLASRFSSTDPEYALTIFERHRARLDAAAAPRRFRTIMEFGPGTVVGSSLLFWADAIAAGAAPPVVVLWDRFANLRALNPVVTRSAAALAEMVSSHPVAQVLEAVAGGRATVDVRYELGAIADLRRLEGTSMDLVYSQSALEHVWEIGDCWKSLARISSAGAWHSHQIDLMDHGRREQNYLEMCEWSELAYYCSMRSVPGALNRWRAGQHLEAMAMNGLEPVDVRRTMAAALPVPRRNLAQPFRSMTDEELLTTTVEIVARRTDGEGVS